MHRKIFQAFEEIDAAVFSGATFEEGDAKSVLQDFVGRWRRELDLVEPEVNPELTKKLTFGELQVGQHFLCFPEPGDNSGHGGYLGATYLFLKTSNTEGMRTTEKKDYASTFSATMPVLWVVL